MLAGCSGGGDGQGTATEDTGGSTTTQDGGSSEPKKIGISQHRAGGSWITAFFEAGKVYAKQQGLELKTFIHEQDAATQISQVRQMINQEYDGIVLVPWNESLNSVIEEADAAGIPVFTTNSDATTPVIKSFTAFGNRGAGETCAEKMYESLTTQKPDVGTYRVLNVRGDYFGVSNARTEGFLETIKQNDDVEIVDTIQTNWTISDTQSKVLTWLNGNETPHGIYSSNMTSGLGAFGALEKQGLVEPKGSEGHVVLTQLDGGPQVNPKIGDGLIDAAVDQPNYFYIPLAIKQMQQYWENGESAIPEIGSTLTTDDYQFESVEHRGVQLWSEPIWAPANVEEKDGHPHVKTNGITITQENADAPYLWGNIWG
jgi:ribose transport system substrate-binding protein